MAFLRPGKKVGVIEFQGIVGRGIRVDSHLPLLEQARKSARYGAVVLAIDSPGGSTAVAEELHLADKKLVAQKPGGIAVSKPSELRQQLERIKGSSANIGSGQLSLVPQARARDPI